MREVGKIFILLLLLMQTIMGMAFVDSAVLDHRQLARYQQLTQQLRCLVCQNQNLAESNAKLADDLKQEIIEQLQMGKSDAQIKEYLVNRYGEFVLYKPKVNRRNFLLWIGPIVGLLIGMIMIALLLFKKRNLMLTDEQLQKQRRIVDKD